MNDRAPDDPADDIVAARGELLLYPTEEGRCRVECRFDQGILWLSQGAMVALYQVDKSNVSRHLRAIFAEGELEEKAVVANFATTGLDGKIYQVGHYHLDVVIAVGMRVRSPRGTQFRQWATERLREYLVKGFSMDDERLRNPPGPGVPACLLKLLGVSGWHDLVDRGCNIMSTLAHSGRSERGFLTAETRFLFLSPLPVDPLSLPPLLPRPDLPKLGEVAIMLSCISGQAFRAASCLVGAIDRKIGTVRCFEIDTAQNSMGGPIVDLDGRVIGVGGLDLPRGNRRRIKPIVERFTPALPITALQRALAAFDLPTDQFEDRAPTYRCPSCGEPFEVEHERCLTCGLRLPHSRELEGTTRAVEARAGRPMSGSFTIAERLVCDMLSQLGVVATSVRVGPCSFRLLVPGGTSSSAPMIEAILTLDEQGKALSVRLPLVRVPQANHESFFRFLLTLNDQTLGRLRASIDGDVVYLSFAEQIASLRPSDGADMFEEMVRVAQYLRKALGEPFDTKPAT